MMAFSVTRAVVLRWPGRWLRELLHSEEWWEPIVKGIIVVGVGTLIAGWVQLAPDLLGALTSHRSHPESFLSTGPPAALLGPGVDYTQPDLADRIVKGPDLMGNDTDPIEGSWVGQSTQPMPGPGTELARAILATRSNSSLVAIRVSENFGDDSLAVYTESDLADGIRYAVDELNVQTVYVPQVCGTGMEHPALDSALRYAESYGVRVIPINVDKYGVPRNFPCLFPVHSEVTLP